MHLDLVEQEVASHHDHGQPAEEHPQTTRSAARALEFHVRHSTRHASARHTSSPSRAAQARRSGSAVAIGPGAHGRQRPGVQPQGCFRQGRRAPAFLGHDYDPVSRGPEAGEVRRPGASADDQEPRGRQRHTDHQSSRAPPGPSPRAGRPTRSATRRQRPRRWRDVPSPSRRPETRRGPWRRRGPRGPDSTYPAHASRSPTPRSRARVCSAATPGPFPMIRPQMPGAAATPRMNTSCPRVPSILPMVPATTAWAGIPSRARTPPRSPPGANRGSSATGSTCAGTSRSTGRRRASSAMEELARPSPAVPRKSQRW